jgi:CubicO group peptidase (beta-lactamase class C family)
MKKSLFLILTSLLLINCNSNVKIETKPNNPKYSSEVEDRIEKVLNNLQVATEVDGNFESKTLAERMTFYHTPAVSIAIVNNGEIEWARGFGKSDLESNTPTDIETMFQAASVSKPIFALAVMKLKEKGIIDLDKDVNEYLTSWQIPKNGDWQPKITMRQLLSHTAGLTVHGFLGYTKNEPLPTVPQILNGDEPANSSKVMADILPGTKFRYSGGGTVVAQLTVTDLIKKPFPEIIEEELFEPLNLKQSTYSQPLPTDFKYKTATAYPYKNQPINGKYHIYPEIGPAGLWTTPTELATIMIEIQKGLQGKSDFIKKETLEEMLTPQEVAKWIGIGFMLEGENESTRFKHGGWNEGFLSQFRGYKNIGKGVVIMLNSNEGQGIIDEIMNSVAKEYEWPDYLPEETKYETIDNSILNWTGEYGEYKLDYVNGKLFLSYQNQDPLELKKTTDGVYKNEFMNFEIKIKDKQLELTQSGQTKTFDKK